MVKSLSAEQLLLESLTEVGGEVRKEMAKINFNDEKSKQAFNAGILFSLFFIGLIAFIILLSKTS